MKAPGFWANRPDAPGWQATMLSPLSLVFKAGAWARGRLAQPARAGVPVVCIGNLTAGGAGKSPMVAALLQRLSSQGVTAHVVSRGYGGRMAGPHRVDAEADDFRDVGDEPLMLASYGQVWVAKDRVAGARAAAEAGADLVLLDDGFQNPGLHKDASILMVDAGFGFGNGRLIPAGPLREPVQQGLIRADLTVLVGSEDECAQTLRDWPVLSSARHVTAQMTPLQTGLSLTGAKVVAFAGIARPGKFFQTLRQMGAEIVTAHSFGDHQAYEPKILNRLVREAHGQGAMLVTTEKDAVRLPNNIRREALTVQVALEPSDWAPIDALIGKVLP